MTGDPLDALLARWREDAKTLRRRGAEDRAALMEDLAEEAERRFEDWWTEEVGVEEAAAWSGYSRERIRELVREGLIPDRRPSGRAGRGGEVRVRRCDLPRHPLGKRDPDALPVPGTDEGDDEGRDGLSPAERAARRIDS